MHNFLNYVMQGRKQATLIAMLFVFIPLFSWVSSAIMVLVTLQMGIQEGFLLLLWVLLANVAAQWLGYPINLLFSIVGGLGLSWIAAVILRTTASWRRVLLFVTALGLVGIGFAHGLIPDIKLWWLKLFTETLTLADQYGVLGMPVQTAIVRFEPLSAIATGMAAALTILSALFNLTIARWWQSLLYNPEGFRKEMYQLRLDKLSTIGIAVLGSLLFINSRLAIDSLPVLLLPFVIVGLAIVHTLLAGTANSQIWLVGYYGLLILIFPYVAILLAMIAIVDSIIDIKTLLAKG